MKTAALVTGGAKRIGRAIALRLADAGYDIVLHYSTSGKEAERTAGDIRSRGAKCHTLRADLADSGQVMELVSRALELAKGLSLLVNNASIFQRSPIAETEPGLYDSHMAINLRAPFFLLRDFATRCAPGQVINLLDTRIGRDESNYAAYTLSKKSLAELTRMAAREFAPQVRVNAVAPGLILPSPEGSGDQFERMARNIPLQTTGSPEQIADAVMFLVGSDFITGEVIHIDGGEHLL
jgi:NAD(P)-dependent dehydrogenase (short-subunit alcohol dehydrogenase family)